MNDSICCPRCSGNGKIKISKPFRDTLGVIRKLDGTPTISDVHRASPNLTLHAVVQRVNRMEKIGLVKLVRDQRPMRVSEVGCGN